MSKLGGSGVAAVSETAGKALIVRTSLGLRDAGVQNFVLRMLRADA